MKDEAIATLVSKYLEGEDVVSIGTSELGEKFLKKLALGVEKRDLEITFVPTSTRAASVARSLGLEISTLDENEIDLAIEFVDQVDEQFNFIKQHSHSLVRDKMIAQSAVNLVVVCRKENFVKKLSGGIPFEVAMFGYKHTLHALEKLGKAKLREKHGKPYKTETGHYLVDVDVDEIYSLDELEYQAKEVPGVLETGLFVGYADTVILYDDKRVEAKSRMKGE